MVDAPQPGERDSTSPRPNEASNRGAAAAPSEHVNPLTTSGRGEVLTALATAIVRLHKEYYGKGPTRARAHSSENTVVVVLEGGFTRSEETLLEHGHVHRVAETRAALQRSVGNRMRLAVEQILGRRVRSVMSANDVEQRLQIEVFLLHPERDDDREALKRRAAAARDKTHDLHGQQRALVAEQQQVAAEIQRRTRRSPGRSRDNR